MSIINSQPLIGASGSSGYQIQRSVRLRASASAYLSRTPASAGSQTTWTWSVWVKRGSLGTRQFITTSGVSPNTTQVWQVEFNANNKLEFWNQTIGAYRISTQVFRDSSAWYHIVFCADTNNATAQSRFRCWVNGVEITAWDTNSTISSGYSFAYNGAYLHGIGVYTYTPSSYLDGYLTEINFVDGQALTPSSFGETNTTTGVWQPKKYNGTYGTNGFYLNFSDNSGVTATTIGKDYSGNGNNWTPNNISVTTGATYDSMLDVPTPWADGGNGRGNYATLNPLNMAAPTLEPSNGNLQWTRSSGGGSWGSAAGTIAVSSGKWYWETTLTVFNATGNVTGIMPSSTNLVGINVYAGQTSTSYGYNSANGQKYNNGSGSAYGATFTANDVIGVALDLDAGTLAFYKNGVSQGTAYSSLSGEFYPVVSNYTNGTQWVANFGQRPFAYTPPTGFKALNTQNLPDPTIKKGNQYFDATTYTGNGSTQNIVNSGAFQPDLVWTKLRSLSAGHNLVDSVRGATKALYSNLTNAETTDAAGVTAFNSDGFALGSASGYNNNGATAVAWQWKEGATQGFDIVTFTAPASGVQTISHSLGVTPAMYIVKSRGAVNSWNVWHKSLASTTNSYLNLNATAAAGTISGLWGTGATSTEIQTLTGSATVASQTHVAYLFAEVPGFSKFGSYTGNGSTDGPFVFTGFRPKFVLIKSSSAVSDWVIEDASRNTYNVANLGLVPNLSNAEVTQTSANTLVDFLSNGFKLRGTGASSNGSAATHIYMAFAENPFKYSLAR